MATIYVAAKGGQGTTVAAVGHAVAAARAGRSVVLVDWSGDGDALAVLGMPAGEVDGRPVSTAVPGLEVVRLPAGDLPEVDAECEVVVDAGIVAAVLPAHKAAGHRIVLATRACYLALRAAADRRNRSARFGWFDAAAVVLLAEPGRALGAVDVSNVLGNLPVVAVDYSPAIARAVDAGLLAHRPTTDRQCERAWSDLAGVGAGV